MLNFLASLILVSLLIPSGFNFFSQKAIDYSYNETKQEQAPKRINNDSFGIKTTAKSILVIDDNSGAVLYNKDAKAILSIASITKLMTALVFLQTNPDWSQTVKIIQQDQQEGGMVYLLAGEEVTVKDLFNIMLVGSANEAAIALTRISDIPDFVSLMNKKALELQMADTYFLDPTGLSPQNVSSASDLIKLANAAFSQPEIQKAVTLNQYDFRVLNNKRVGRAINTDQLLNSFLNQKNYQILGAKTGYLNEAGYCLLLKVNQVENRSLTLVILGSATILDRWQEAKGLVDWVFRSYSWP